MIRTVLAAGYLMLLPLAAAAESHVTGDAALGEKVFRKCMACHAVGADAKNKVGPVLNGIVDRAVGSNPDFAYSKTLLALRDESKVWTPEELDAFLLKPQEYAKGSKMAFAGLRKDEDRANVIAYLATFKAEGM